MSQASPSFWSTGVAWWKVRIHGLSLFRFSAVVVADMVSRQITSPSVPWDSRWSAPAIVEGVGGSGGREGCGGGGGENEKVK